MLPKTCSTPECERASRARGMCQMHYGRAVRSGAISQRPNSAPANCTVSECTKAHFSNGLCGTHYRAAKPPCSFDGCDKPTHAQGYCGQHYRRVNRHGDVKAASKIIGDDTARFRSKINKAGPVPAHAPKLGRCWSWEGTKDPGGYGSFPMAGKTVGAHRISFELANGTIPEGTEIDHRCHNRACVNPSHLRIATTKQNVENHSGLNRNNKSGVRGVWWDKQHKKWRAVVGHYGKNVHVGLFLDLDEAADAVIEKRIELHQFNDLDRLPA